MKPRGSIADTHRSRAYEYLRTRWASGDTVSTHVYRHRKSGRLWAHKAEHGEWDGHDIGEWYEIRRRKVTRSAAGPSRLR